MNIHESAAYRTVHSFPGGSRALAPKLGKSDAMVRNLVNPNNTTHKLGYLEAIELSEAADDDTMLEAWAARRGYVLVRAEPKHCEASIPTQMMQLSVEIGDFASVVARALADGVVTCNERREIHNESAECFAVLHGVVGSAFGLARAH